LTLAACATMMNAHWKFIMPFQKILDLSTAHMTSKDNKILQNYMDSPAAIRSLIAYSYEYGWTISTSLMLNGAVDRDEHLAKVRKEGFSEAFIKILTHAADNGAVLVRLDRDGDLEPGLPSFDWDNDDEIVEPEAAAAPKA
jgi:hypothetical protein